jgi:hypothetical protein
MIRYGNPNINVNSKTKTFLKAGSAVEAVGASYPVVAFRVRGLVGPAAGGYGTDISDRAPHIIHVESASRSDQAEYLTWAFPAEIPFFFNR